VQASVSEVKSTLLPFKNEILLTLTREEEFILKILSIGAHIGDAELMSGPYLSEMILQGHQASVLALTAGEKGNPQLDSRTYRSQKIREHTEFCRMIGAHSVDFEREEDGNLVESNNVSHKVARVIDELKPDLILGHWSGSFHPDHRNAHKITVRATFLSQLPKDSAVKEIHSADIKYSENWEDMNSFAVNEIQEISENAFEVWRKAIDIHEFAHGGFSNFKYIDYYVALMTLRGCLGRAKRGVATMNDPLLAQQNIVTYAN
jgi:LmbE family N-acetylglucosaminyl deacetylase